MTAAHLRDTLELVTPAELAELIGVKTNTLAMWRCYKRGPDYIRAGKNVFYRRIDIDEWLRANSFVTNRTAPVDREMESTEPPVGEAFVEHVVEDQS